MQLVASGSTQLNHDCVQAFFLLVRALIFGRFSLREVIFLTAVNNAAVNASPSGYCLMAVTLHPISFNQLVTCTFVSISQNAVTVI